MPRTFHSARSRVAVAALFALLFAQVAAGMHTMKHLSDGDAAGLPGGSHVQLCLECVSFAPLESMHGGGATALAIAPQSVETFLRPIDACAAAHRWRVAFQSRAPPR